MTEAQLHEQVRALLLRNERHGYSGLLGQHYCYIAPALKPYPFQWFWDSCFHVVMLARLGEYGYDGQQAAEPRDPHAAHNLWESVPGDFGAHGRFDDIAKP